MTTTEVDSLLRAVLPNVSGFLVICALLLSAILAEVSSRLDHPSDRHRVLTIAVMGSLGVVTLGLLLRLCMSDMWVGDLLTAPLMLVWLAALWLAGSLIFTCRLLIGSLAVNRVIRAGAFMTGDDVAVRVAAGRAMSRLGLDTAPAVCFSEKCEAPFVAGVLRPTVLLPEDLRAAETRELTMVLTHEFAHVRRGDCFTEFATQLLGTLLWWNPLFWFTASRLRDLREEACDRAVVSGLESRVEYARLLVRYATKATLPLSHAFAHVRMADRASLNNRIRLLVGEDKTAWKWSLWAISNRDMTMLVTVLIALAMMLDAGGVVIAYDLIDEVAADWQTMAPTESHGALIVPTEQ